VSGFSSSITCEIKRIAMVALITFAIAAVSPVIVVLGESQCAGCQESRND